MMTSLLTSTCQTQYESTSRCTVCPTVCGQKMKLVKSGQPSLLMKVILVVAMCVCLSAMIVVQTDARHSRLQRTLQARYVSTYASATDQPLRLDIRATAGDLYTVKAGTVLHHSTDTLFTAFHERPTWMSLDRTEGFKMVVAQSVRNLRDMYSRKLVANRDLKLFLMKRLQRDSEARLTHYATAAPVGLAAFPGGFPVWYSAPSKNPIIAAFVDNVCAVIAQHGFDGWRNPWDQDEIMLCPVVNGHGTSVASKVSFVGGYFCPYAKTSALVADGPSPWAKSKQYYIEGPSDPLPAPVGTPIGPANPGTQRFHFFVMKPIPNPANAQQVIENPALNTLDLRAAADFGDELFGRVCCRFDAQFQLYHEIEQIKADLIAFPAPAVKNNQQPTKEQAQIIKKREQLERDLALKQKLGIAAHWGEQANKKCDR